MPEHIPSPQPPSWLQVSITTDADTADAIAAFIGTIAGGVEQIPLPGSEPAQEKVVAYLPEEGAVAELLAEIKAFVATLPSLLPPRVETASLSNQDWNKAWKERFKPLPITPHLVIKPTWETYQPAPGEKIIEMDPGMAFGTGHHASTRLALELIELLYHGNTEPPATVLDVGTGTGILAMGAVLFGAQKALAIDNDPEAVAVALDNIAMNRLSETVEASGVDLDAIPEAFSLVIANIIHDTLVELAASLCQRVAAGGYLILAGILVGEQTENIRAVYQDLGLLHQETRTSGEWSAMLLTKPQAR
ncbi:MAG: 50S ribosomal protein L11 methyltransferase [Thermodesulfobacteriota bacterium]